MDGNGCVLQNVPHRLNGGREHPCPHVGVQPSGDNARDDAGADVLSPSRMAKRDFSSIAIGLCNSTVSSALSPGITISAPFLRATVPVTSVVRK